MKFTMCCAAILVASSAATAAPAGLVPADKELQFWEGYTSSVSKLVNSTGFSANQSAREAMKGAVMAIPAGWRLVNVLPRGTGFLMFFQEQDGSVRTLGLDSSGFVSGGDTLLLRSYR